jgi:hypothetical protein
LAVFFSRGVCIRSWCAKTKSLRLIYNKMPSVGSFKAQPVTRTFAITQGPDSTGVYYFTQSRINDWYADNSSEVNKLGEGFYIVKGNFYNIMNDLNNNGSYDGRKSLIDFGKEIVFGNEVNSRLIVLRRVQFFDDSSVGGDGREGYVCVENNTSNLAPSDWGRYTVRVART